MSDITKKISFIESEGASGPALIPDEPPSARDIAVTKPGAPPRGPAPAFKPIATPLPDSEPVLRRSDDPLTPKRIPPAPKPIAPAGGNTIATSVTSIDPAANRLSLYDQAEQPGTPWLGIGLAVLTALGLVAWTYGYFRSGEPLTPWAWAGLATAVIVPTATVVVAAYALRALAHSRMEANRLVAVTERLLRVDANVEAEVSTLAGGVRREIVAVDAKIADTRAQLEAFAQTVNEQGRDLAETTRTMAERSETVGRALALHRQAFESLGSTFDTQMESLAAQIDTQRGRLAETTGRAKADLTAAQDALSESTARLTTTSEAAKGSSLAAKAVLDDAEGRMGEIVARVQDSAGELDAVYERRAAHLSSLTDRLSGERDGTERMLFAQTERLSAIDAQIEITETRLTALVDHAKSIQDMLASRLEELNATLDGADERTRRYTEDLGSRVTDSVADARRDLSVMEAELRALQSRLKTTEDATLSFEADQLSRRELEGNRVHLRPLETDFPPVEPPRIPAAAPARIRPLDEAPLSAPLAAPKPAAGDDPLELVELAEVEFPPIPEDPEPVKREVVTRPGDGDAKPGRKRAFGRAGLEDGDRRDWRWRDMLGGIDPLDERSETGADTADAASATASKSPVSVSPAPASTVVRPPAGVPLSAVPLASPGKAAPLPAAPALPDGSDVVARLCEVQLAPSAVVDEGTIIEAGRARLAGGDASVGDVVLARLGEPVAHLRGVLSADLEFKLRAESFCRSFGARLDEQTDDGELRATLGSASGRAYLLCVAALRH